MNRRIAYTAPVLVALMVTAVSAREDKAAGSYKTPDDAFNAAKKASAKKDYKAIYNLLAPASQELLTAQVALLCVATKNAADVDPKAKGLREQVKPILEVMKRHGLSDEAVKKLKPFNPKADAKEQEKVFKEAVKPIKDRGQFVDDALTAMRKVAPKGSQNLDEIAKDKLSDVKIDGEKATGKVTGMRFDPKGAEKKQKTYTFSFEKIQGSWRIVLPQPAKGKETED
jgi:hypothetical protein